MLAEEGRGAVAAPGVLAGEKVEFEPVRRAGSGEDRLDLAIAGHGVVDHEARIIGADIHEERPGRDQSLSRIVSGFVSNNSLVCA